MTYTHHDLTDFYSTIRENRELISNFLTLAVDIGLRRGERSFIKHLRIGPPGSQGRTVHTGEMILRLLYKVPLEELPLFAFSVCHQMRDWEPEMLEDDLNLIWALNVKPVARWRLKRGK